MITQMAERLTGDALLEKVKELGQQDISKADLVRECGFSSVTEDGREKLEFTAFYEELLKAKGIDPDAEDKVVLFGEFTLGDLKQWWEENKPDYKGFGDVHGFHMWQALKWGIERQLTTLLAMHSLNADDERTPQDERDAWVEDKEILEDIIARLKGIQIGENDPFYKKYESKEVAADPYLSGISDHSLEVLKTFGGEAPHILNEYSVSLEDVLMDQVKMIKELQDMVEIKTGKRPHADYQNNLSKKLVEIRAKLPNTAPAEK